MRDPFYFSAEMKQGAGRNAKKKPGSFAATGLCGFYGTSIPCLFCRRGGLSSFLIRAFLLC